MAERFSCRWLWCVPTALFCFAFGAHAQDQLYLSYDPELPVVLYADEVTYSAGQQLATASGSVEVHYDGKTLRADELNVHVEEQTYTAPSGVSLEYANGALLIADEGDVKAGFTEGAFANPALIFPEGGGLAAVSAERHEGRYSVLHKSVFSACEVCEEDPSPLWQIKAERVVHDEQTRQIAYQNAVFEVKGFPVAWLPAFWHPDPTVKRNTGLLNPTAMQSNTYGYGLKLPVYFNLAPERDLTLTPFVTVNDGLILEGEYRALTASGAYTLSGAATKNESRGESNFRGFLNADGAFRLTKEISAGFDIRLASDDTFLRRYEYTDIDRQTSRAYIDYIDKTRFIETNAFYFQSYRPDEPSGLVPYVLPEVRIKQVVFEDETWGNVDLTGNVYGLFRPEGSDTVRAALNLQWGNEFIDAENGLVIAPFAEAQSRVYQVLDNADRYEDFLLEGAAGVDVSWPLVRHGASSSSIIEPMARLAWSGQTRSDLGVKNEDSLDAEYDETALFTNVNRFAGFDRWEEGGRLSLGVRYDYQRPDLGVEAAYGIELRPEDNVQFTEANGLKDAYADHVGSLSIDLPGYGISAASRLRFDPSDKEFERLELSAQYDRKPLMLSLGYARLEGDPEGLAKERREEFVADGSLQLSEHWSLSAGMRYDVENNRNIRRFGDITYEDECIKISLGVDLRSNSVEDAEDSTSFGLNVSLKSVADPFNQP